MFPFRSLRSIALLLIVFAVVAGPFLVVQMTLSEAESRQINEMVPEVYQPRHPYFTDDGNVLFEYLVTYRGYGYMESLYAVLLLTNKSKLPIYVDSEDCFGECIKSRYITPDGREFDISSDPAEPTKRLEISPSGLIRLEVPVEATDVPITVCVSYYGYHGEVHEVCSTAEKQEVVRDPGCRQGPAPTPFPSFRVSRSPADKEIARNYGSCH